MPQDYLPNYSAFIPAMNEAARSCHGASVAAGWWTDLETGEPLKRDPLALLMLVTTEIAEAAEGFRKDCQDDHLPDRKMAEVEICDALIRLFDIAGYYNFDLSGAMLAKLRYNRSRSDHSIEARKAAGGKKF